MKKINLEMEKLLAPIAGDNPCGEDVRYSGIYEEIKEARRADDNLALGDWQRDLKTSDWDKVINVSTDALAKRTKDLQIAAWLTEALIIKGGFSGLADGLTILGTYIVEFWDNLYPQVDDGDLEFRTGPFVFLNDKISPSIKNIPVTDPATTEGYSWLRWQESRQVGFEKDLKNQYGDIDDSKKRAREDKIAEGKITGEQFDAASAKSSKQFYITLNEELGRCKAAFEKMDAAVEDKFGRDAPRLSELGAAIEDNAQLAARFLKDKGGVEPALKKEAYSVKAKTQVTEEAGDSKASADEQALTQGIGPVPVFPSAGAGGGDAVESSVWRVSLDRLGSTGIKDALQVLLDASASAPSVRQKNRYKLLMAKLSLKADRPDLARPVIEQLYALIDELGLERWESSVWIAEVIDAYYRCLTVDGASSEDIFKAKNELFPKLCTRDITKAISYKEQINSGG
jgi:type VI secretion system protein ImpA